MLAVLTVHQPQHVLKTAVLGNMLPTLTAYRPQHVLDRHKNEHVQFESLIEPVAGAYAVPRQNRPAISAVVIVGQQNRDRVPSPLGGSGVAAIAIGGPPPTIA